MYGSMTTLILIMLWLYMCMYVILLGGEINALLDKYYFRKKRQFLQIAAGQEQISYPEMENQEKDVEGN